MPPFRCGPRPKLHRRTALTQPFSCISWSTHGPGGDTHPDALTCESFPDILGTSGSCLSSQATRLLQISSPCSTARLHPRRCMLPRQNDMAQGWITAGQISPKRRSNAVRSIFVVSLRTITCWSDWSLRKSHPTLFHPTHIRNCGVPPRLREGGSPELPSGPSPT